MTQLPNDHKEVEYVREGEEEEEARYSAIDTMTGSTILFDRENENAWIQMDNEHTVDLREL